MILKCAVVSFLLLVVTADRSTCRLSPLPNAREKRLGKFSLFDITKNKNLGLRSRRGLSTTITLLWPQVVGPVEQGVIEEHDYESVPKTRLEYRLDLIRKKAKIEEQNRLMVRDYMKRLTEAQDRFYGVPPYGNGLVKDYT